MKQASTTMTHIGWDDEETAKARLATAEKEAIALGWQIKYGAIFHDRLNDIWGYTIMAVTEHKDG